MKESFLKKEKVLFKKTTKLLPTKNKINPNPKATMKFRKRGQKKKNFVSTCREAETLIINTSLGLGDL